MKKETYLRIKRQKRTIKLFAILTILSMYITKAKADEIDKFEQTKTSSSITQTIETKNNSNTTVSNNNTTKERTVAVQQDNKHSTSVKTTPKSSYENVKPNEKIVTCGYDASAGVTEEVIAYAKRGHTNGPQAYETWYPNPMSTVVENMRTQYGYTNLEYKVRADGVKTLSGTAPDGTKFIDLVMVAADVRHPSANPDGTFERGQFVETTLGRGIVVDACGEAISKRKYNRGVHFDIATAWHEHPFSALIYGNNKVR